MKGHRYRENGSFVKAKTPVWIYSALVILVFSNQALHICKKEDNMLAEVARWLLKH